jgi:hypothetical protein
LLAWTIALATCAPPAVSAQQFDSRVLRQAPAPSKQQAAPVRPRPKTSCAEYGAGFVRVESTGTCMRIGGGVDIDVRAR